MQLFNVVKLKKQSLNVAKIIKSPKAEQDLVEIWEYIAEDNEVNADKFLNLIQKKCRLLSENLW